MNIQHNNIILLFASIGAAVASIGCQPKAPTVGNVLQQKADLRACWTAACIGEFEKSAVGAGCNSLKQFIRTVDPPILARVVLEEWDALLVDPLLVPFPAAYIGCAHQYVLERFARDGNCDALGEILQKSCDSGSLPIEYVVAQEWPRGEWNEGLLCLLRISEGPPSEYTESLRSSLLRSFGEKPELILGSLSIEEWLLTEWKNYEIRRDFLERIDEIQEGDDWTGWTHMYTRINR